MASLPLGRSQEPAGKNLKSSTGHKVTMIDNRSVAATRDSVRRCGPGLDQLDGRQVNHTTRRDPHHERVHGVSVRLR